MKASSEGLRHFLLANLADSGFKVNSQALLLIVNLTVDYMYMCGHEIEEEEY